MRGFCYSACAILFVCTCAPTSALGQDLVLIPPNELDFLEHYYMMTIPFAYCGFNPTQTDYNLAHEPSTADINGGWDASKQLPVGNGMPDVYYEMAIIASILKKPEGWRIVGPYGEGVNRNKMMQAWNDNIPVFIYDLGDYKPALLAGLRDICYNQYNFAGHRFAIYGALLLTGDNGSLAPLQAVFDFATNQHYSTSFSPSHYCSFPHLLGPEGDADRDGYSNRQEYAAFARGRSGSPAAFLSAVLDPNIKPEGTPLNTDDDQDGLSNDREDLNLNGVVDPGESDPLNPDSDGDGLGDAVEVLQWGSDPLSASDCPQVPATTPGALAALWLALGVLGLRRVARG